MFVAGCSPRCVACYNMYCIKQNKNNKKKKCPSDMKATLITQQLTF